MSIAKLTAGLQILRKYWLEDYGFNIREGIIFFPISDMLLSEQDLRQMYDCGFECDGDCWYYKH